MRKSMLKQLRRVIGDYDIDEQEFEGRFPGGCIEKPAEEVVAIASKAAEGLEKVANDWEETRKTMKARNDG